MAVILRNVCCLVIVNLLLFVVKISALFFVGVPEISSLCCFNVKFVCFASLQRSRCFCV